MVHVVSPSRQREWWHGTCTRYFSLILVIILTARNAAMKRVNQVVIAHLVLGFTAFKCGEPENHSRIHY